MKRLEPVLVGLFLACFVLDLLVFFNVVSLAGSLPLGLYGLYSFAITLGWLSGMLYERHRRGQPAPIRRRLFLVYFLGPPWILYLVRLMAPLEAQREAPLAWLYSFAVFAIFFAVPVKLPVTPR